MLLFIKILNTIGKIINKFKNIIDCKYENLFNNK